MNKLGLIGNTLAAGLLLTACDASTAGAPTTHTETAITTSPSIVGPQPNALSTAPHCEQNSDFEIIVGEPHNIAPLNARIGDLGGYVILKDLNGQLSADVEVGLIDQVTHDSKGHVNSSVKMDSQYGSITPVANLSGMVYDSPDQLGVTSHFRLIFNGAGTTPDSVDMTEQYCMLPE